MSFGYARSVQLRGASYCSPGKTLTATRIETPLALKKPPSYSQYSRDAETPVFVSQYRVMLSRTSSRVSSPVALVLRSRAAATAAAGWPSASLWSSSQAARPTGESAMPYKVCGRAAMYLAYSTCLKDDAPMSSWRESSAERPDDGGSPAWRASSTSAGTVAGMLEWMASNPAGACKPIWSTTNAPQSPPWAT